MKRNKITEAVSLLMRKRMSADPETRQIISEIAPAALAGLIASIAAPLMISAGMKLKDKAMNAADAPEPDQLTGIEDAVDRAIASLKSEDVTYKKKVQPWDKNDPKERETKKRDKKHLKKHPQGTIKYGDTGGQSPEVDKKMAARNKWVGKFQKKQARKKKSNESRVVEGVKGKKGMKKAKKKDNVFTKVAKGVARGVSGVDKAIGEPFRKKAEKLPVVSKSLKKLDKHVTKPFRKAVDKWANENTTQFIKAMTEKNYAEANKYLKAAVNSKLVNTIQQAVKKRNF